ncbi:MAG TPA: hypothetical protein DDZ66_10405 [Firmicutes bacterium]|nr:hypothetical protein [Bacillota bacterium]
MCEGHFPEALRGYLLAKYREEPFPYQFTEQDLYEHIRQDIQDYKAGRLDVTAPSPWRRTYSEMSLVLAWMLR